MEQPDMHANYLLKYPASLRWILFDFVKQVWSGFWLYAILDHVPWKKSWDKEQNTELVVTVFIIQNG